MRTTKIEKWVAWTIKASVLLLIVLALYGTPLPSPDEVLPEIARNLPIQENIMDKDPYSKEYASLRYTFTPHASYEIWGLIVSLHQSDSALDISHEFDPANTTDVCVVWGKNIEKGRYLNVTYDHGDFTCYYKWDGPVIPDFQADALSNSHLIPTTLAQSKLIQSLQVGDQIHVTGTLADYTVTNESGEIVGQRRTSLVRNDTGNGACEILLLSEVEILKRNVPWRISLRTALFVIIFSGISYQLYAILPKHRIEEVAENERPHQENPYDIQNFLKKKLLQEKAVKPETKTIDSTL